MTRPPKETGAGLGSQQARQMRRDHERYYQAILESAPEAILGSRADGRIIFVNRQAERLFGYDRASLLDLPLETLIPERFQRRHQLFRASYAAAPPQRPPGSGLRLFGRRRDGSEFPAEISLNPLEAENADGESLIIATVHDLSAMQRTVAAHADLEAANQELRQLLALTDTALSTLALDDLLRELLLRAQGVMDVDKVAILLLDESGQELRVRAARGLEEEVAAHVRVPVGQGFAGRIAATRAPLIVNDLSSFLAVNAALREQLRSAVGVPLLVGERLLGVLQAGSATPRHFSDQDIRLLGRLGERIALAIDRAQLLEATQAARAQAEREQARWQATMESAPAFVVTCDADRRLTYINPTYARLLGPRDDLSVPPEDRPTYFGLLAPDGSGPIAPDQTPLTRALRERRVIPGVELLYRDLATGTERLVRWDAAPMRGADGSVLGAVCVGWDITDERRLERAVYERAAQLEAIFEAMTDSLFVFDREGRIFLSNAAARAEYARFFPDARETTLRERIVVSRPTDEYGAPIHEEQSPQARALRGEVVNGEHPMEVILHAPNGEVGIYRVTAAPLRDAEGNIVGAVSIHRDVTARKRLEQDRQEALARELAAAEVSQRLEEFFAIAAHDIRNPVTTVSTSLQALQRRLTRLRTQMVNDSDAQAATLAALEAFENTLRTAHNDVERLIRLINRLFDTAQARAGQLELRLAPCDLAVIAREQVAAQQAAEPERAIALDLPGDQPVLVTADADRLGEVLANYLNNALKYSPNERPVVVRLEALAGRAKVSVRDEGPGLPPEEQALVWEMFHRVPGVEARGADTRQRASLGLGLHICKRLVEAHPGGQVGVESVVADGATFWFSLPLAEDASPPGDQ